MNDLEIRKRTKILWYCAIKDRILFISDERKVYEFDYKSGNTTELKMELYRGHISFRIKGTSVRFSKKTLSMSSKRCNIVV